MQSQNPIRPLPIQRPQRQPRNLLPQSQVINQKMDKTPSQMTEYIIQYFKNYSDNHKLPEKYQAFQDSFSKMNKTAVIDFQCTLSKQPIKFAVYLSACAEQKQHFEQYFDLQQFLENYYTEININEFACPCCQNRITKFDSIEKAFFPQILVNRLLNECGGIPKNLTYVFAPNIYYPNYQGEMGKKQNQFFEEILNQMKKQKRIQSQFYSIIKKDNLYQTEFLFYNLCSLSQMKVMIPVRGQQCEHMGVYDFCALICHFKDTNQQQISCVIPECKKPITLKELQIDHDLFQASLKTYSFSFSYKYLPQCKQLVDTRMLEKDQNLMSYKLLQEWNDYEKYQQDIYRIVENIYNNPKNQEKTDTFYEKHPINQLGNEKLSLMQCEYTHARIELPCRCIRCPKLQVCDLRFMSCVIYQFQHQEDVSSVIKNMIVCPLCSTPFIRKVKPKDLSINEQVYIDLKVMQFLSTTALFAYITKEDYIKYLNNQVIPRIQIIDQDSLLLSKMGIFRITLQCPITKNKITRPVRGKNCKHPQPFDLTILDLHYKGEIDLTKMICPVEQCGEKIDNLVNDHFLKYNLDIYYAQMQQDSTDVNISINSSKQLTIKPKK